MFSYDRITLATDRVLFEKSNGGQAAIMSLGSVDGGNWDRIALLQEVVLPSESGGQIPFDPIRDTLSQECLQYCIGEAMGSSSCWSDT